MKKKLVIVLALALTCSVAGCSSKNEDKVEDKVTEVVTETVTSEEEATPTNESDSEGSEDDISEDTTNEDGTIQATSTELTDLLDQMKEHVQIGTAGSSLVSAKYAASLLDWAMNTTMTEDEVKAAVIAWLEPQGNDVQTEFADQLAYVDGACDELTKENAPDLLSSAGCEDTLYPWNDTAFKMKDIVMNVVLGEDR